MRGCKRPTGHGTCSYLILIVESEAKKKYSPSRRGVSRLHPRIPRKTARFERGESGNLPRTLSASCRAVTSQPESGKPASSGVEQAEGAVSGPRLAMLPPKLASACCRQVDPSRRRSTRPAPQRVAGQHPSEQGRVAHHPETQGRASSAEASARPCAR